MVDKIRVQKVPNHSEVVCEHLYDKLKDGKTLDSPEIAMVGFDMTLDGSGNRAAMCEKCGDAYANGVPPELVKK